MEFQFGTNWSQFSREQEASSGSHWSMEGVFSFFLESAFLGLFLFGEHRLGQWGTGGPVSRCFSDRGSRGSSSSSPTRGCSIRSYTRLANGGYDVASFWGAAAESMGAGSVRAQHVRCAGDGRVRDGGDRSVLPAGGQFVDQRASSSASACRRRLSRRSFRSFRPAICTADTWRRTARHDGRDGRAVQDESGAPIVILGQPDADTSASTIRSS